MIQPILIGVAIILIVIALARSTRPTKDTRWERFFNHVWLTALWGDMFTLWCLGI
jgi:hypothetical protein